MASLLRTIRLILMLTCDHASHLVSDSLDRRLTRTESLAMRAHLFICGNCRRFRRQLQLLRHVMIRVISGDRPGMPNAALSLSAEARQRMRKLLSGEDTF